jgi:hypothetical protein
LGRRVLRGAVSPGHADYGARVWNGVGVLSVASSIRHAIEYTGNSTYQLFRSGREWVERWKVEVGEWQGRSTMYPSPI